MGGDEVLEHIEPFGEVGLDGQGDDAPGGIGHQPAHARQLTDLLDVTARAGRRHHEDRIEGVEAVHGHLGDVLGGLGPDLDCLLIALIVGDQAAAELLVDGGDLALRGSHDLRLVFRRLDVHRRDRDARLCRVMEADPLDFVDDPSGDLVAVESENVGAKRTKRLLVERLVLVEHGGKARIDGRKPKR